MSIQEVASIIALLISAVALWSTRSYQSHSASREEAQQLKKECSELRERVTELERELKRLRTNENELLMENHQLRQSVDRLSAENKTLRHLTGGSSHE